MKEPLGPALSWNDLANFYDASNSGRRARTLPMQSVWVWAERQTDKLIIDPVEGTIHERKQRHTNESKTAGRRGE